MLSGIVHTVLSSQLKNMFYWSYYFLEAELMINFTGRVMMSEDCWEMIRRLSQLFHAYEATDKMSLKSRAVFVLFVPLMLNSFLWLQTYVTVSCLRPCHYSCPESTTGNSLEYSSVFLFSLLLEVQHCPSQMQQPSCLAASLLSWEHCC